MGYVNARNAPRLLPLVLALSLTGCASLWPNAAPQVPPPPEELMKPPPSETFSERARIDIEAWLKKLTDLWARSEACRTTPQECA